MKCFKQSLHWQDTFNLLMIPVMCIAKAMLMCSICMPDYVSRDSPYFSIPNSVDQSLVICSMYQRNNVPKSRSSENLAVYFPYSSLRTELTSIFPVLAFLQSCQASILGSRR